MSAHLSWLQAEAAADRKDWKHAEQLYRQSLALSPQYVPSLIGLSTALSVRGSYRDAHATTLSAFSLQPDHPSLIYAIAQRLRAFNEFERLEKCLSHPAFASSAPITIVAKGVVMLSAIGSHSAAVRMADQALRREPTHAAANHVRGNLHLFSGEPDAAEACYERSIAADPFLFQNSWMLASVRTQTPDRHHIQRLREQLTRARPGGEGEAYLAFGLHKELHDLQDYPGAWDALARGCSAKRQNVTWSIESDRATVDEIQRVCTEEFVACSSAVQLERIPIFIIGMHRSGTTLMERMLAGHSMVGDAGETGAFDAQAQYAADYTIRSRHDAAVVRHVSKANFDEIAHRYSDASRWLSRGKPYFTEKLPMNFWNAGFIAKALPQAKILHLQRNPMDTCFSNLRTLFAGVATYSYVQEELASFYLEYRRLMEHWRAVLPKGQMLDVIYDELVADPEGVAARIAQFCGLPYEASMVAVDRSGGRVATASAALARQGIRKDRGQVWRHYERQVEPLIAGLRSIM